MDGIGDGPSSHAGCRRPLRRWICIVLHGSTTGRPPWPLSRLGRACQGRGGTSGSGWVEDAASMDPPTACLSSG
jgi:hypothetical protein